MTCVQNTGQATIRTIGVIDVVLKAAGKFAGALKDPRKFYGLFLEGRRQIPAGLSDFRMIFEPPEADFRWPKNVICSAGAIDKNTL